MSEIATKGRVRLGDLRRNAYPLVDRDFLDCCMNVDKRSNRFTLLVPKASCAAWAVWSAVRPNVMPKHSKHLLTSMHE